MQALSTIKYIIHEVYIKILGLVSGAVILRSPSPLPPYSAPPGGLRSFAYTTMRRISTYIDMFISQALSLGEQRQLWLWGCVGRLAGYNDRNCPHYDTICYELRRTDTRLFGGYAHLNHRADYKYCHSMTQ